MSEPQRVSDSLGRIERALSDLWTSDESAPAKPRSYAMNLIVVTGLESRAETLELVDRVSAELAARTFILWVDPKREAWSLDGEVSAVCRLEPGSSRPAICAERIELYFEATTAVRARSILDTLIESRIPRVLYVGPGAHDGVVDGLAPSATRVVLDSALHGTERSWAVAQKTGARIDDMAFVRGRRFRDMVARFFDDPAVMPALSAIRRVEIAYSAAPRGAFAAAEAQLLLCWLGSRLGWRAEKQKLWAADGSPVEFSLERTGRSDLSYGVIQSVAVHAQLTTGGFVGKIERDSDNEHLSWSIAAVGLCCAPHRFAVPERSPTELLVRALSDVAEDSLVRDALEFAASFKAAALLLAGPGPRSIA